MIRAFFRTQFDCRSFKRWCKRRGIRARYGVLGEPSSICIVERFIRSLKDEGTRRLVLVPIAHGTLRRELEAYVRWYNTVRPHTTLAGKTPHEVFEGRSESRRRLETRPRWPNRGAVPCGKLDLAVGHVAGRKHLPVIGLRRAA
jgi:hypothetical protein